MADPVWSLSPPNPVPIKGTATRCLSLPFLGDLLAFFCVSRSRKRRKTAQGSFFISAIVWTEGEGGGEEDGGDGEDEDNDGEEEREGEGEEGEEEEEGIGNISFPWK